MHPCIPSFYCISLCHSHLPYLSSFNIPSVSYQLIYFCFPSLCFITTLVFSFLTPKPVLFSVLHSRVLSPPISPILLLAHLRQSCELRLVKMYWKYMRSRRRKWHYCQNGIFSWHWYSSFPLSLLFKSIFFFFPLVVCSNQWDLLQEIWNGRFGKDIFTSKLFLAGEVHAIFTQFNVLDFKDLKKKKEIGASLKNSLKLALFV